MNSNHIIKKSQHDILVDELGEYSNKHCCYNIGGTDDIIATKLQQYAVNKFNSFNKHIHIDFDAKLLFYYGSGTDDKPIDNKKFYDKLQINNINADCLSYQNNSTAFLMLLLKLKNMDCQCLYIIQPSYFIVYQYCQLIGLKYENINLIFDNQSKTYKLPYSIYDIDDNSAIWITSPILFTNQMLTIDDINALHHFISTHLNITFIFDESLALHHNRLFNKITLLDNTFFIYSMYKSIGINGLLKNAYVLSTLDSISNIKNENDLFEYYQTKYLKIDNIINSIEFFNSTYYDSIYDRSVRHIDFNLNLMQKYVSQYKFIYVHSDVNSQYCLMYAFMKYSIDDAFYFKIIENTKTTIIPAFDKNVLKNNSVVYFRINLLQETNKLLMHLQKIISFLINYSI